MSKPRRAGIGNALPTDDRGALTAQARALGRRAAPGTDGEPYGTTSIHMPLALLAALRDVPNRRANRKARENPKGRGGRPSVSEIMVELLERHTDELAGMDRTFRDAMNTTCPRS
jgi:hypothetical protein